MNDLIKLIKQASMVLIIHDFQSEHIKNTILSIISVIDIAEFNNEQFMRDLRINETVGIEQYYHCDLSLVPNDNNGILSKNELLGKAKSIQRLVRKIQDCISMHNKFILTSVAKQTFGNGPSSIGGNSPMYTADLSITIMKKENAYFYSIIKNRYGSEKISIPLNEFNRLIKIDDLLYNNL